MRKRRNKKERFKALKANTKAQMKYLAYALNDTTIEYKKQYFESDLYRLGYMRRNIMTQGLTQGGNAKKALLDGLKKFYDSPFKDDKLFMLRYVQQKTRDSIEDSEDIINSLFFDKIFKIINISADEQNSYIAVDILCNLMPHIRYRKKLADQGYFR
jgi:hypothetical protein